MACWYRMRCDAMGWDMDVGLSDFTLVSLALWLLRLCGMAVTVIGGRRRGETLHWCPFEECVRLYRRGAVYLSFALSTTTTPATGLLDMVYRMQYSTLHRVYVSVSPHLSRPDPPSPPPPPPPPPRPPDLPLLRSFERLLPNFAALEALVRSRPHPLASAYPRVSLPMGAPSPGRAALLFCRGVPARTVASYSPGRLSPTAQPPPSTQKGLFEASVALAGSSGCLRLFDLHSPFVHFAFLL